MLALKYKERLMLKTYTLLLASTSLLFTACDSEKTIDKLRNTNNSTQEHIAKKDIVYIIKYTPEMICKSTDFKNAAKDAIKTYQETQANGKSITVKKIETFTQPNTVTCQTYIPKDKADLTDPICKEKKATDIQGDYALPEGVELNEEVNTSCVVTGDVI